MSSSLGGLSMVSLQHEPSTVILFADISIRGRPLKTSAQNRGQKRRGLRGTLGRHRRG